jgi:hypothetical protein
MRTAYTASSRVWFTFWNGIVTEVYYPSRATNGRPRGTLFLPPQRWEGRDYPVAVV